MPYVSQPALGIVTGMVGAGDNLGSVGARTAHTSWRQPLPVLADAIHTDQQTQPTGNLFRDCSDADVPEVGTRPAPSASRVSVCQLVRAGVLRAAGRLDFLANLLATYEARLHVLLGADPANIATRNTEHARPALNLLRDGHAAGARSSSINDSSYQALRLQQ